MQFPIVREYQTDLADKNPENVIEHEPFTLELGSVHRIVVPKESPFRVEDLTLYFPSGEPMVPDVDWRPYALMPTLTALMDKDAACTILILNDTVTKGTVSYKTIGEISLFDSSLIRMLDDAINDERPIQWDAIKNKPLGFTPIFHGHSLIYNIVAFKDLIEFLNEFTLFLKLYGSNPIYTRANTFYERVRDYVNGFKQTLADYLNYHKEALDSHGVTPKQLGLGNVDNVETADSYTFSCPRDDLRLTPNQLGKLLKLAGVSPNNFLPANQVAISQYGDSWGIPPGISNRVVGRGALSPVMGICLEGDGTVSLIGNRSDGRYNALFYFVLDDYTTDTPDLIFTSTQYVHPRFTQDAATPNRICSGSGKDVILVGDSVKEFFYLGISNGTFNPGRHIYTRIDLSPILAAVDSTKTKMSDYLDQLTLSVMGEYTFLIFSHGNQFKDNGESALFDNSQTYKHFWRVKTADIKKGVTLFPEQINLSYTDMEGHRWSGVPIWRWCNPDRDPGTGFIRRFLFKFDPATTNKAKVNPSQLTFSTPNPNTPGEHLLKFMGSITCVNSSLGKEGTGQVEIIYSFNPVTGVMKTVSKSDIPVVEWNEDPLSLTTLQDDWGILLGKDRQVGVALLEDGTVISNQWETGTFPNKASVFTVAGYDTPDIMVGTQWTGNLIPTEGFATESSDPSLVVGAYPAALTDWILYISRPHSVVFNGKEYPLPRTQMDVRGSIPSPANKTLYLYLSLVNGVPTYSLTEEKRYESPTQAWIATLKTDANRITSVEGYSVFTLNGYRVSEAKRGHSIPATSGSTQTEGKLPWLKAGEMLP